MHLINAIPSSLKDYDFEENNGFVPINKVILQKRIHDYRFYLDYLIKMGIIEENLHYIVGEKSRGIRFTPLYNTVIKRVYITKKTLIKSITVFRKSNGFKCFCEIDSPLKINNLFYLEKWWSEKLRIDFNNAKGYLDVMLEKDRDNQITKNPMLKFNARFLILNRLHNSEFIFNVDTTSGRLHTLLTQIKTELRQFITYDGKSLSNIDIVNSQPFLSTIFLDDEKLINNNIIDIISLYNPKFRNKGKGNTPNQYSTMLINFIKENKENKDVIEYIEYVKSGNFYEFFGKKLIERGKIESDQNYRKIAKSMMFIALFSSNPAISLKIEIQIFKEIFPTVYQIFSLIKTGRGNHRTLSCVLQNIEAKIILMHAKNYLITTRRSRYLQYMTQFQLLQKILKL